MHKHDHKEHHHHHSHHHSHSVVSNLKVAFFLNTAFMIIEFVAGFITNSVALMSDAVHDLGDTISLGSAIWFEKYSHKNPDQKFNYGYRRFSIFSAFINGLILLSGSVFMLFRAIPRLFRPEEVISEYIIPVALLGLFFNGLAVLRLSDDYKKSHNQRSILLHIVEDLLGWVAILAGAIVMYLTDIFWIDPLLSVLISLSLIYNAYRNLRPVANILLQAKPQNHDEKLLSDEIRSVSGVLDIHDMRVWSLDDEYNVMTLHIVIADETVKEDMIQIKKEVSGILKKHNIKHFTIELEFRQEQCDFSN
jgi:cobalt-zinc-cadmium efflux system protein